MRQLAAQLHSLPQSEIQKSLDYYEELIDDNVEDGRSEEEAVAALGFGEGGEDFEAGMAEGGDFDGGHGLRGLGRGRRGPGAGRTTPIYIYTRAGARGTRGGLGCKCNASRRIFPYPGRLSWPKGATDAARRATFSGDRKIIFPKRKSFFPDNQHKSWM